MIVPQLPTPVGPVEALREVTFWLDRERTDSHRVLAYRRAADALATLEPNELELLSEAGTFSSLPGFGPSTSAVAREAVAGDVPRKITELRDRAKPLVTSGGGVRAALRGDLHSHTRASDGIASVAEMAEWARRLGHEYLLVTDHSPRLTVAHGLDAARLAAQGEEIDALNATDPGIRVLKGIEVDILADGALDQSPEALAALDLVVASVHWRLRDDSETMTRRMVAAIANRRTNVLGHCTGRLVEGSRGVRPPSDFDVEVVFAACAGFGVAVEINSRPERCDPPDELLALAVEAGCLFAIDTDAHAPGQLDFQWYGCARAEAAGIPPERIVNTWPADDLLAWAAQRRA